MVWKMCVLCIVSPSHLFFTYSCYVQQSENAWLLHIHQLCMSLEFKNGQIFFL